MRRAAAVAIFAALDLVGAGAHATSFRPRFEPTDLELEDPGTLELDLQLGPTTGDQGAGRFFLPDYELDVGLLPRFELDVDGAVALEPLSPEPGAKTRLAIGEPLWTSAKIGIADVKDVGALDAAALGLQLGPRLPLAKDLRGAGYEALALLGLDRGNIHVVVNAGGLVDPRVGSARRRPLGFVGGLDLVLDVDEAKRWSLLGEAGGGYYVAEYPKQLTLTGGAAWDAGPATLSVIALYTPIGDADRLGALVGVSPKIKLF